MRKSEKRMATFVRMLLALTLTCISVCKAGKKEQSIWTEAVGIKHRDDRVERQSAYEKDSVEETLTERKRRSLSQSDRTDSVTMMNNLRRTVGSSNMPYLSYDDYQESNAATWTFSCNYDAGVNVPNYVYGFKRISPKSEALPALIRSVFPSFSRELSSVYLTSFGCDINRCSFATGNGQYYQDAQLTLCLFQGTSAYNETRVQYKLGEGCTECDSGSFWCDYGLCRADCGPTDSCYCNSYCLNCASTDQTTCRCQCLQGWSGTRCGTQYSDDAETPICSTTARSPRMLTTISVNNAVPIGASFLQIVLCVVVVLFLRA